MSNRGGIFSDLLFNLCKTACLISGLKRFCFKFIEPQIKMCILSLILPKCLIRTFFIPLKIGKKRKVSVREFKGKVLVDIREYYEDQSGAVKPGKKGTAAVDVC